MAEPEEQDKKQDRKREKKTTSESISYKVGIELDKYDALISDKTIRKSWSNSAKLIDAVEFMNIEMLAMAFTYLYLQYRITFNLTQEKNMEISKILLTSQVGMNNIDIIIKYISTRRGKDIDSKNKKSHIELWEKNKDVNSKICVEVAIYSFKILESLRA